MNRATDILRAAAILLGGVTTATLAFQVAMNASMDISYWDTGDASSGRSIWFGVVAVGLLLGATILVPHLPRVSAVTCLGCLPLVWIYEQEQNRNFLSLELSESISVWITLAIFVLALMTYISARTGTISMP